MRKPLTKKQIFAYIDDFCDGSWVLKNKSHASTFTVNELVYCLESISHASNIDFQINNETGMYIPCTWREPYFIDSATRGMHCEIVSVEPINIADEEEAPDWEYLIVITTHYPKH